LPALAAPRPMSGPVVPDVLAATSAAAYGRDAAAVAADREALLDRIAQFSPKIVQSGGGQATDDPGKGSLSNPPHAPRSFEADLPTAADSGGPGRQPTDGLWRAGSDRSRLRCRPKLHPNRQPWRTTGNRQPLEPMRLKRAATHDHLPAAAQLRPRRRSPPPPGWTPPTCTSWRLWRACRWHHWAC
jgi:hypothetical protein